MFFRNLTFFRFPERHDGLFQTRLADDFERLADTLRERALKPVGPLELSSRGFIPPLGRDAEALAHSIDGGTHVWVAVGGEDRLLPGSVVDELLAQKLDAIEKEEGRRPGGKTRKRIRDELITELLPRSFVKPSRLDAYFDFGRCFIAVDSSSRRAAEGVVSEVRSAAGSFPALPLNAEVAPRAVLTSWLAGEAMPAGFQLGDECELHDPIDKGAVIKVQRMELASDEVAKHLEAGRQCTRLALVYAERVSFVFGEDLVLRKVRFLDGAVDKLENTERDDLRAELDARFALQAGEVGELFDVLARAFRFSSPNDDAAGSERPPSPPPGPAASSSFSGVSSVTITAGGESVTLSSEEFSNAGDALQVYAHAVAIVRESGNTGIAHLQRKLKVGYNRAARLLEAMEARGVVSPPDRDGKRELLSKERA